MGTPIDETNYTDNTLQNQAVNADFRVYVSKPRYDADVQIDIHHIYPKYGTPTYVISHTTKARKRTSPTIISHKEGITVGCSFITNAALEEIYQLHKKFLKVPDEIIHQ